MFGPLFLPSGAVPFVPTQAVLAAPSSIPAFYNLGPVCMQLPCRESDFLLTPGRDGLFWLPRTGESPALRDRRELSKVKLFMALSRTPHGVLDLATPALAAVLAHGGIPSAKVVALGLFTAFAGYTAVYALNDVFDYRADLEKFRAGFMVPPGDLDAMFVRHPLAQGFLGYREGLFWAASWAVVALIGAYRLNPVCAYIFLAGSVLEGVYCTLLRVHPLRTVVSGVVKTSGGVAGVFAVDPNPSRLFVALLFAWLFLWEIGGQNVPNDWADVEEDCRLGARTVPVFMGPAGASLIVLFTASVAAILGCLLPWLTPVGPSIVGIVGSALAGAYLLGLPAWRLRRIRTPREAGILFNRGSFYPLAVLGMALVGLTI
jgi:4-hydroxybenzoate polyprenyltransferase